LGEGNTKKNIACSVGGGAWTCLRRRWRGQGVGQVVVMYIVSGIGRNRIPRPGGLTKDLRFSLCFFRGFSSISFLSSCSWNPNPEVWCSLFGRVELQQPPQLLVC
jgi:hypothetical protein